jgi:hypothetical protein
MASLQTIGKERITMLGSTGPIRHTSVTEFIKVLLCPVVTLIGQV